MVLDPIPQSLPVHFFGSRPQPPTSHRMYKRDMPRMCEACHTYTGSNLSYYENRVFSYYENRVFSPVPVSEAKIPRV